MKIKDISSLMHLNTRPGRRFREGNGGPNLGTALLGIVCVAGVFGLLTLLFHLG